MECEFCAATIAQRIYGLARANGFLAGFPNFENMVKELKCAEELPSPQYEVCIPLPDGHLAIQEGIVQLWTTKYDLFVAEASELIADHNKKFNPKGVKRSLDQGTTNQGSETADQPAAKRICVEETVKTADCESSMADKWHGL